jgi:hypothetical protein
VRKIFRTCTVLTFLNVAPLAFAQIPPPSTALSPEVSISVHNYADVPTELLTAAEDQAREIFRHAGLETVWLNCSPKLENLEPASCYFGDATHLTLKISPHAMNAQVRDRIDVLGTAYPDEKGAGYFAYVFYDRVQELAQRRRLGHALLADVMAHEIGHLLLGSNSHSMSGIMCAHWNYDELRHVAEGAMSFVPAQARIMRDRLRARQSGRLDLAPFARQQTISATASALPQDEAQRLATEASAVSLTLGLRLEHQLPQVGEFSTHCELQNQVTHPRSLVSYQHDRRSEAHLSQTTSSALPRSGATAKCAGNAPIGPAKAQIRT